jgi:hypothetical protein
MEDCAQTSGGARKEKLSPRMQEKKREAFPEYVCAGKALCKKRKEKLSPSMSVQGKPCARKEK